MLSMASRASSLLDDEEVDEDVDEVDDVDEVEEEEEDEGDVELLLDLFHAA